MLYLCYQVPYKVISTIMFMGILLHCMQEPSQHVKQQMLETVVIFLPSVTSNKPADHSCKPESNLEKHTDFFLIDLVFGPELHRQQNFSVSVCVAFPETTHTPGDVMRLLKPWQHLYQGNFKFSSKGAKQPLKLLPYINCTHRQLSNRAVQAGV